MVDLKTAALTIFTQEHEAQLHIAVAKLPADSSNVAFFS